MMLVTSNTAQLLVSNRSSLWIREQLALEVIDRAGPGGEYVTSDHTLSHFREGWSPTILGNRANERVKEILASHAPKLISDDIETKVKAMIADAETSIS